MGAGKKRVGFLMLVWAFLLLFSGCYGKLAASKVQERPYAHLVSLLEDEIERSKETGDSARQLLLLNAIAELYTVGRPSLRTPSPTRGFLYNNQAKKLVRKIKKEGAEKGGPADSALSPEKLALVERQLDDRFRRLTRLIRTQSGIGAGGIGFGLGSIPVAAGMGGVGGCR